MAQRTYVPVNADIDEFGVFTPRELVFRGTRLSIDRVTDRRQAHATKTGGQGMRYTVRIGRHVTYLFQDDAQRFFVEEMDHVR